MQHKILLIIKSDLLRNYLNEKLNQFDLEITLAVNGIDGLIKMRNQLPDLIVMDFNLPRLSGVDFLKEKYELKGTRDLPIIMLSSKVDRTSLIRLGKYKVYKFLSKPLEIDLLLSTISELLNIQLNIDTTPCIIDVHLNNDILFIEVAEGLNPEKIEILKYKILEIMSIYETKIQKILVIISEINLRSDLDVLVETFFNKIVEATEIRLKRVVLLTVMEFLIDIIKSNITLADIKLSNNFTEAMEYLGMITSYTYTSDIEHIQKDLVTSKDNKVFNKGSINLKFSEERKNITKEVVDYERKFSIAVVDDDLSILEFLETVLSEKDWEIHAYENGKIFIEDMDKVQHDLIFLDLQMPEMSGFDVLKFLKGVNSTIPVIVLTCLADKNSIIRAREYGAKSYLIKPVTPGMIVHKADEILKMNF